MPGSAGSEAGAGSGRPRRRRLHYPTWPTSPRRRLPPPVCRRRSIRKPTTRCAKRRRCAIAGAKSLDDISEFDAETLFSDAELDLVSAALASAADWTDADEPTAAPAPSRPANAAKAAPSRTPGAAMAAKPARPRPEAAKAAAPAEDDPFDFLGLGDDAPLELIDDSAPPPNDRARKSATR